jgi:hypothetical protein
MSQMSQKKKKKKKMVAEVERSDHCCTKVQFAHYGVTLTGMISPSQTPKQMNRHDMQVEDKKMRKEDHQTPPLTVPLSKTSGCFIPTPSSIELLNSEP